MTKSQLGNHNLSPSFSFTESYVNICLHQIIKEKMRLTGILLSKQFFFSFAMQMSFFRYVRLILVFYLCLKRKLRPPIKPRDKNLILRGFILDKISKHARSSISFFNQSFFILSSINLSSFISQFSLFGL